MEMLLSSSSFKRLQVDLPLQGLQFKPCSYFLWVWEASFLSVPQFWTGTQLSIDTTAAEHAKEKNRR